MTRSPLARLLAPLALYLSLATPASAAGAGHGMAPMQALGLELLLLIPLAALAVHLKKRKRAQPPPQIDQEPLMASAPTRIADGAKAQILSYGDKQFLVIHAKNGAAQAIQIIPSAASAMADVPAEKAP